MNVVILDRFVCAAVALRMNCATAPTEVILQLNPKSLAMHQCHQRKSTIDHHTKIERYQLHSSMLYTHDIHCDCLCMDICKYYREKNRV